MRAALLPVLAVLAVLQLSGEPPAARAGDWPQWLGPERDGVWRESGMINAIPAAGLPVKWRARVLNGWSGPAVAEGRVYVTDHDPRAEPEVERVLCFEETWSTATVPGPRRRFTTEDSTR